MSILLFCVLFAVCIVQGVLLSKKSGIKPIKESPQYPDCDVIYAVQYRDGEFSVKTHRVIGFFRTEGKILPIFEDASNEFFNREMSLSYYTSNFYKNHIKKGIKNMQDLYFEYLKYRANEIGAYFLSLDDAEEEKRKRTLSHIDKLIDKL